MKITYTALEYIESYRAAVDAVAREKRYLLFVDGPSLTQSEAFVHSIIARSWTQFLAVDDEQVVGWCDITFGELEAQRHVGHLGIGVLPEYRGQGLGKELMQRALDDAFSKGIERVELGVFASNARATALYRRFGFALEGRKRRAWCCEGRYEDMLVMGVLKDASA
jgi:RimJ/RimL family protein N-acetyltransferase